MAPSRDFSPGLPQPGMVRTRAERGSPALRSRHPRSLFLALAGAPLRAQDAIPTAAAFLMDTQAPLALKFAGLTINKDI